jgi:hypothetical protein
MVFLVQPKLLTLQLMMILMKSRCQLWNPHQEMNACGNALPVAALTGDG